MNYLVIDLEMCRVPYSTRTDKYPYKTEVIQIGAVLLDEEYNKIASLSEYVRPVFGVIDGYIASLTGIHKEDVKHAPHLREALQHLIDWIGKREYITYAWSTSDYLQLKNELGLKGIPEAEFGSFMKAENWIDYQEVFDKRFGRTDTTGLQNALRMSEVSVSGSLHNGMDDAVNTAKLIRKLELNPNYMIREEKITEREEEGVKVWTSAETREVNNAFSSIFRDLELLLPA